jgi:hypothetical protein
MAPLPTPSPEVDPGEAGRARERARGARLVAVFLVGCTILIAPLPRIASQPTSIFGLPTAFVYLFVGWGLVIGSIGLAVGRRNRDVRHED